MPCTCNVDLTMECRARLLKVLDLIASPEFIVKILESVISMFIYRFLRDDTHLSLIPRLFVFWLIYPVYLYIGKWIRRQYLTDKKIQ
ncbi:hypothetical protein HDV63DRAFT_405168 [Trichoderma sp. SZMC 28014]